MSTNHKSRGLRGTSAGAVLQVYPESPGDIAAMEAAVRAEEEAQVDLCFRSVPVCVGVVF